MEMSYVQAVGYCTGWALRKLFRNPGRAMLKFFLFETSSVEVEAASDIPDDPGGFSCIENYQLSRRR